VDHTLFNDSSPGLLVPTIQGAKAFVPHPLPPLVDLSSIFAKYGEAMAGIGALNAKIAQLRNPHLIIRPLQRREALLSSAMEGTYTTSDELALLEAGAEEGARADTREVLNYTSALSHAMLLMETLPICHRLIKETHGKLLSGLPHGRGGNKRPGEYKSDQNWIGGQAPQTARFLPPPPLESAAAMDALEAFINRGSSESIPPLLEAALVHYQFETIHPFLDGNGRIGRLLIALYLVGKRLLRQPCLYVSDHLEKNRAAYYDALTAVRTRGDLAGWVKFFLVAINETAKKGVFTFQAIHKLREQIASQIHTLGRRAANAARVVDSLYLRPVTSSGSLAARLDLSQATSDRILADLQQLGIVAEMTGQRRNRVFYFREYYHLFLS